MVSTTRILCHWICELYSLFFISVLGNYGGKSVKPFISGSVVLDLSNLTAVQKNVSLFFTEIKVQGVPNGH